MTSIHQWPLKRAEELVGRRVRVAFPAPDDATDYADNIDKLIRDGFEFVIRDVDPDMEENRIYIDYGSGLDLRSTKTYIPIECVIDLTPVERCLYCKSSLVEVHSDSQFYCSNCYRLSQRFLA